MGGGDFRGPCYHLTWSQWGQRDVPVQSLCPSRAYSFPLDHAPGRGAREFSAHVAPACLRARHWPLLQAHSPSDMHLYIQGCPRNSCLPGMLGDLVCRQQKLSYMGMRDQDRARGGMRREGWAREPALPSHHVLAQNSRSLRGLQ